MYWNIERFKSTNPTSKISYNQLSLQFERHKDNYKDNTDIYTKYISNKNIINN